MIDIKGEGKTILVTGGAGFLGSHLVEKLIASGASVVCLDDFSTGIKGNIAHLLNHPRFKLIEQDVTAPINLAIKFDHIYNLASPASPIHYQSDPVRTTKTNVLGAINVLNLAIACGARILQASTSEVYGEPLVHPQVETDWGNVNPHGLRSCYDEGKRCVESLFFDYYRQHYLDIRVVRIFNTYGPKMRIDDGRVVSNFIVQALRNEDITIYGDGQQTRSFCYVDDLIDGFILFMNFEGELPIDLRLLNIGNPDEFTVSELANIVIRQTNSKSKVIYKDLPLDDPTKRRPNIHLIKSLLSWEPASNLSQGLSKTIEYFDSLLNQNKY